MIHRHSHVERKPDERCLAFYRRVLERLIEHQIPFLVGGAYALLHHTGIDRCTRDFDVFIRPEDVELTLERLTKDGFHTELTFPHWLAKVKGGGEYVDLIFSSGNGIARVDSLWFDHSIPGEALGFPVRFCPVEEMIWSKGFIMERERFDGADVLHLLRVCGRSLDWTRLRSRYAGHGSILLVHLILLGFVYPGERDLVPRDLIRELTNEALETGAQPGEDRVCLGTLLSRSQYLPDLARGYRDGRLPPHGTMTPGEIAIWTAAADEPEPLG